MSRILIVDDEPSIGWALQQALIDEGHDVDLAASAEDAWSVTARRQPDVIVMDVRLPGVDGLTAMEQLPPSLRETPVVIMTAFGNLDTAVRAINSGAFEYLTKPFDLDQAVSVITRALESSSQFGQDEAASPDPSDLGNLLVGESPVMQAVFRQIALAAEHDVPVLITGESGTGKELVALALHRYGNRSQGPFVPVCVPAMSDALVESELFGHQSGAFTGATSARKGLLELAQQGIAFFDEIGDVTPATQVKLLRVLETKQVLPVGGTTPIQCDFRLIAATNCDLPRMVEAGEFREDLFYRLNVYRIDLPPLRERTGDILLLARHFLANLPSARDCHLSAEALHELSNRPWYGNVRELRNAIEHVSIVARTGHIEPVDLPPPIARRSSKAGSDHDLSDSVTKWLASQRSNLNEGSSLVEQFLAETEPLLIRHALAQTGGNRQEAAALLGMHRQTLREKLRRYQLDELS
ncbi:MAG: sigma-54 dependent transcriptional regulator [Planctomycetaceae bacterium]